MPLARSAPLVTSLTYAWAVETFPPLIPSMIRARNTSPSPTPGAHGSSIASPRHRNPTTLPACDTTSTGRRPNRSESDPSTGPAASWHTL